MALEETSLGKWTFSGIIVFIAIFFIGAVAVPFLQKNKEKDRPGRAFSDKVVGDFIHPVVIHEAKGKPWIDTGEKDRKGQAIQVECATCHDTRAPNFQRDNGDSLKEFHQGLKYQHGSRTCLSCHHAEDYNRLQLADGRAIDFSESLQLCAQCHGPQYRDYKNGSHGGMTGYWDLKQGPRERNHCTDCHDPHHPKYPLVMPVFPPKPVVGEAILPKGESHSH